MTDTEAADNAQPILKIKPEPALSSQSPGWRARTADLAWLVRRVMAADPRNGQRWIVLALIGGLITPVQLWSTKGVADNLQARLDGGAGSLLWWFAALWVTLVSINLITTQLEDAFAATTRERGGASIAADVLDKATRIDLAAFEHQGFYDGIVLILTTAEQQATSALREVGKFGWVIPNVVTWGSILIAFDWRLALIAVVPLLPAIREWFFSGMRYWDVFNERTRERRLAAYYAGLLSDRQAAKEIRLFGLAPILVDRWEHSYWATAHDLRNRGLRIGIRQRGVSLLSMSAMMLGLAWYVSIAPTGASAGTVVVVISSFLSLYGGLLNLAEPISELGKASGFAGDLRSFLHLPNEDAGRQTVPGAHVQASEVRLDTVSFTYPGTSKPVVSDLSLIVKPGETIALVGENGAGKSTLVKLMLGLYHPDSGCVSLNGTDLASLNPAQVRRHLSGVFQQFVQYPVSLRDNVTLGDHNLESKVESSLDLAGMGQVADCLPSRLDTLLAPDLGGADLSGGQWQRLAIARAGIRNATFLALDEPTAALDPLAEVAIFRRFAELAQGRTTVLVSHRLGIARLADRIVVMRAGQIIEQGTHDELVRQPGSDYASMWNAQARWYQ